MSTTATIQPVLQCVRGQITALDWIENDGILLAGEGHQLLVFADVLKPAEKSSQKLWRVPVFAPGSGSIHLIRHAERNQRHNSLDARYIQVLCACGSQVVCCWLDRLAFVHHASQLLVCIQREVPVLYCRILTGIFDDSGYHDEKLCSTSAPDCLVDNDIQNISKKEVLVGTVHGQIFVYHQELPADPIDASSAQSRLCRVGESDADEKSNLLNNVVKRVFYSGMIVAVPASLSCKTFASEKVTTTRKFLWVAGTAFGEITLSTISLTLVTKDIVNTKPGFFYIVEIVLVSYLPGAHAGEIFDIVPYWRNPEQNPAASEQTLDVDKPTLLFSTVSCDRSAKLWHVDARCVILQSGAVISDDDGYEVLKLLCTFGGAGSHSGHNSRMWRCAITDRYLVCAGEDACCSVWPIGQFVGLLNAVAADQTHVSFMERPVEQLNHLHSSINIWSVVAVETSDNKLLVFTGGHDGAIWLTHISVADDDAKFISADRLISAMPATKKSLDSLRVRRFETGKPVNKLQEIRLPNDEQPKFLTFLSGTNAAQDSGEPPLLLVLGKRGTLYIFSKSQQTCVSSTETYGLHVNLRNSDETSARCQVRVKIDAVGDEKLLNHHFDNLTSELAHNHISTLQFVSADVAGIGIVLLAARSRVVYVLALQKSDDIENNKHNQYSLVLTGVCSADDDKTFSSSACQLSVIKCVYGSEAGNGSKYLLASSHDGKLFCMHIETFKNLYNSVQALNFVCDEKNSPTTKIATATACALILYCCAENYKKKPSDVMVVGTRDGTILVLRIEENNREFGVIANLPQFHYPSAAAVVAGFDTVAARTNKSPRKAGVISSNVTSFDSNGGVCDILHPIPSNLLFCDCCASVCVEKQSRHVQMHAQRQFMTLGRDDGMLAHWSLTSSRNEKRRIRLLQLYRITCCKTLLCFVSHKRKPANDVNENTSSLLLALGFQANQLVVIDLLRDHCLAVLDGVGGPNRCISWQHNYSATKDAELNVAFTFHDGFVWHSMPYMQRQYRCLLEPLHGHEINAVAWVADARQSPPLNLKSSAVCRNFVTAGEDCCVNLCRVINDHHAKDVTSGQNACTVQVLATLRGHLSSVRCLKAFRLPCVEFIDAVYGGRSSFLEGKNDDEQLTLVVSGGGRCQLKVWCIFGDTHPVTNNPGNLLPRAVLNFQIASFMPLPLVKKRWNESADVALDSDVRIMDCDVVFINVFGTAGDGSGDRIGRIIFIAAACSDGEWLLLQLTSANDEKCRPPESAEELREVLARNNNRGIGHCNTRVADSVRLNCCFSSGAARSEGKPSSAFRNCCLQRIRFVSTASHAQLRLDDAANRYYAVSLCVNLVATGTDGVIELLEVQLCTTLNCVEAEEGLDKSSHKEEQITVEDSSHANVAGKILCQTLGCVKAHQSGIAAFDVLHVKFNDADELYVFASGGDDGSLCAGLLRPYLRIPEEKTQLFSFPVPTEAVESNCFVKNALTKIAGVRFLATQNLKETTPPYTFYLASVSQQQECVIWRIITSENITNKTGDSSTGWNMEAIRWLQLQTADINAFDVSERINLVINGSHSDKTATEIDFAVAGRGLEIRVHLADELLNI